MRQIGRTCFPDYISERLSNTFFLKICIFYHVSERVILKTKFLQKIELHFFIVEGTNIAFRNGITSMYTLRFECVRCIGSLCKIM